jgi:hypothetical protein
VFRKRNTENDSGILDTNPLLFKLRFNTWKFLILLGIAANLVIIVSTWAGAEWAKATGKPSFTGSLYETKTFSYFTPDGYNIDAVFGAGFPYDCFAAKDCSHSSICEMFTSLFLASHVFTFCELSALILLVFWAEGVF